MTSEKDEHRAEIRRILRSRRAELSTDERDAASMAVTARLANIAVLNAARFVAGYRAVRGEVSVDSVLMAAAERGAVVTLPRVEGDGLDFVEWQPGDPTITGRFGVAEPAGGRTVEFGHHTVALVPLVAFDSRGHRLGQGGGYYDRAIAGVAGPRPVLIGIAHSFQQVKSLPTEPWDMRLDAVVTDERVHEFEPGSLDRGL